MQGDDVKSQIQSHLSVVLELQKLLGHVSVPSRLQNVWSKVMNEFGMKR